MADFSTYLFNLTPYSYQLRILEETSDKAYWAWLLEMGLGKSRILIDNAAYLYLKGEIDALVFVGPKGSYANFYWDQLPTHLPPSVPSQAFLFSTLVVAKRSGKDELARFLKPAKALKVFIINVEAFITDSGKAALTAVFKSFPKVIFALDESTCVKNIDAARSKAVYAWAAKAKYRRIMTGSPVTQSPLDLYGQSLVLGKGILGHSSFYSFRGEYATLVTDYFGQRAVKRVSGYRNLDKLSEVIKSFSTRLTKEECLDLPPKVYSKLYVEMTPEQQRLYEKMRDEALLTLNSGEEVEVTTALAQIVKLHQISCGQLKLDDRYVSIENNRVPALLTLLEGYAGKVIIWANYRQTLEDVIKALREGYGDEAVVGYYGGVSEADRALAIKGFQDPKSPVRFFVANPQSGGYGLTLTAAQLVVYYSNGYSLEQRLQSEDRAHRIGQTGAVTYVDLVSRGTVDEKIIEVLRGKKDLANEVMGVRNWAAWL